MSQTLPFDESAEAAVLGCHLTPSANGARDPRGLTAEAFYLQTNGTIFQAILDVASAGTPVNAITVSHHLLQVGKLDEVGGAAFVHSLANAEYSPTTLPHFAEIVRELAMRREQIRIGHELVEGTFTLERALETLAHRQAAEQSADGYALVPLDFQTLIRDGVPEIEYIEEPYFPKGARIWIWGATGAYKSLYCAWIAAKLSRRGVRVSYFSEENPIQEDLRRLSRLQPDPDFYRIFHRSGMDLLEAGWIKTMLATTQGDEIVFLDSLTDLWTGDEDGNRAIQQFDAMVLKPMQRQGTTPVVLDHTGHKYMFSDRSGATSGRGASSKGQKADVALEFKLAGDDAFTIVYGKSRIGGLRQSPRTFKAIDGEDGRLEIIEIGSPEELAVKELAEKMVEAILTAPEGRLTTTELRAAVGGKASRQSEALGLLDSDSRVRGAPEKIQARDGKFRDAKVWRSAAGNPLGQVLRFPEVGE